MVNSGIAAYIQPNHTESPALYTNENTSVWLTPTGLEPEEPVEPEIPANGAPSNSSNHLPPINTISEPTPIETTEEFLNLKNQDGYYVLTNNIDFKGGSIEPISGFTGHLDGAGHTISDFVVSGDETVGLFSTLSEGYIGNLTLKNYTLSSKQSGVLAGTISQTDGKQLTIENITLGEGTYNRNGTFLGGIASLVYQKGADCQLTVRDVRITGDNVASTDTAFFLM